MNNPQTMDKGIRIMGGCVLIGLSFAGGAIDFTGKVVAIIVGLYGLLTGIINFCPLGHFILKEKKVKRKKASAGKKIQADDVKELYFFAGLNDEEIGNVLAQCRLKHYHEDQAVIVEGKHKKILFIIYSGEFKIIKAISETESKIVDTISDGETFGELSFFDHLPPSVSVVSMGNSKVLEIDEIGFSELIGREPFLGIKVLSRLMRITSNRMRSLDEQIVSLGNRLVQGRPPKNKT
jgi:CRP-like cAMP-binding protein